MANPEDEPIESSPSETVGHGLMREAIEQMMDEIRVLQHEVRRHTILLRQMANQLAAEEHNRQQADEQRDEMIRNFLNALQAAVHAYQVQDATRSP